ncbi:hypothetical protein BHE74_00010681, partial [Ensete ventricosum]
ADRVYSVYLASLQPFEMAGEEMGGEEYLPHIAMAHVLVGLFAFQPERRWKALGSAAGGIRKSHYHRPVPLLFPRRARGYGLLFRFNLFHVDSARYLKQDLGKGEGKPDGDVLDDEAVEVDPGGPRVSGGQRGVSRASNIDNLSVVVITTSWSLCRGCHLKEITIFATTMASDPLSLHCELKAPGDGEFVTVIPVPKRWNLVTLRRALQP